MHELPPTGVRGRVGISFKLGVIVLLRLPLFHRHMRLFVYYLGLFVYYLGFRSLSLCRLLYALQGAGAKIIIFLNALAQREL